MKFKIKINEETTLRDIRTELENLKTADVIEIPLNHIRKITSFLGAIEVQDIGSSIRFKHQLLADHPEIMVILRCIKFITEAIRI